MFLPEATYPAWLDWWLIWKIRAIKAYLHNQHDSCLVRNIAKWLNLLGSGGSIKYMKCLVIILTVLSISASAFAANMLLHYDFNDIMGTNILDASGNGHTGYIYGSAIIVSNDCGGVLQMSGYSNYVLVAGSPDLKPSHGVTVSAWYKAADYARQRAIVEWNDAGSIGFHMWAGVWAYEWGGRGTGAHFIDTNSASLGVVSIDNASADIWHHLAVTCSSNGSARVYLDGVLRNEKNILPHPLKMDGNIYIGMRPGMPNDCFKGLLDEIKIFDGPLSSNEIYALVQNRDNCEPAVGQIELKVLPESAAGAVWQIEGFSGTNTHSCGTVITDVPVGIWTVSVQAASGWLPASAITIAVHGGMLSSTTVVMRASGSETNNLVLYYDFNSAGDYAIDRSGCGNHGWINNCGWHAVSESDYALELYGTNSYVRAPSAPSLNVGSFTLAAWCKTYNYILQRPIIEWNNGTNLGVHMWMGVYGSPWGDKGTGANIISSPTWSSHVISIYDPPPNLWYHLAVSYDQASGVACLYLNGQLRETKSLGSFTPATAMDVYIGKRPTQIDCWSGLLDEVRIYGGVLTSNEVLDLYIPYASRVISEGSIRCSLTPSNAVLSGAAWRLAGETTWRASGSTANNLPAGDYSLEFKPISGWQTPDQQTAAVGTSLVVRSAAYLVDVTATNELVLHYEFELYDDLLAKDSSGSGLDGALHGGEYVAIDCGHAFYFDGVDDYISLQWPDSVLGARFSLAAWFKVNDYARQRPILEWFDTNTLQGGVHMWTGVWGWQWAGKGTGANIIDEAARGSHIVSTSNPEAGIWHHLAVTYDAALGLGRVYVDGSLMQESVLGSFSPLFSEDLFIGYRPGQNTDMFSGWLDDIRVYSGCLSGSDVAELATMSNCSPSVRSVTVQILPDAANDAGAAWRPVGLTNWLLTGETANNLASQDHGVEFRALVDWQTPAILTARLSSAVSAALTGVYVYAGADTVAPSIISVFPADGFVSTNSELQILVTVTDNVGVAGVKIKNADALQVNATQFVANVSNIHGSYNSFIVKAWDAAGNHSHFVMNYGQAKKISLACIWDGYWRVRNPFETDVAFQWQVQETGECGAGLAQRLSDTYFVTSTGDKTVDLIIDSQIVDSVKSSGAAPKPVGLLDGSVDSDEDGFSNAEEDIAGTDINDADSVFSLLITTNTSPYESRFVRGETPESGQLLTISWQAQAGSVYTIQKSIDLANWFDALDANQVQGIDGVMTYTNDVYSSGLMYLRCGVIKKQ